MTAKTANWRPGPTVCRCCLAEGCYKDISTEYFWMGKREVYAEMLSDTFSVSISYSKSGGPNSNSRLICEPCISRLRDASEFRRQVLDCEKTFMQHLDPGSSSAELPEELASLDEVKVERVKIERDTASDDDFDTRADLLDDDDDDDRDGVQTPRNNCRKKRAVKSTTSITHAKVKQNASSIIKCWDVCPFKWFKNAYKCAYCDQVFRESRDLREHVRECKKRGDVDIIYRRFKEYGLINIDITDSECRFCGTPYQDLETMREHVKQHKLDFNVTEPDGVMPFKLDHNQWQCVICKDNFNNFLKLYSHINVHYQYNVCAVCGKGFSNALRLRRHAEVHIKGTFPCDRCEKVFHVKASRDYHKVVQHLKRDRYMCPKCNKRFEFYAQRAAHLEKGSCWKEIVHECALCNINFNSKTLLSRHVRSEH